MTAITPLLILDCETTGLKPDRHTVWEIAWVTAWHDIRDRRLVCRDTRQFMVELTLAERAAADDISLDVGRFHERYPDQQHASKADVIAFLQQDIANIAYGTTEGTSPPPPVHLVGAVPSFDHNMLAVNFLGWPGYKEGLWHYHLVDVEVLAAGKLGVAPPYSSTELTEALGVVVDERDKHTALGDVRWAIGLYAAVYGLEVF